MDKKRPMRLSMYDHEIAAVDRLARSAGLSRSDVMRGMLAHMMAMPEPAARLRIEAGLMITTQGGTRE